MPSYLRFCCCWECVRQSLHKFENKRKKIHQKQLMREQYHSDILWPKHAVVIWWSGMEVEEPPITSLQAAILDLWWRNFVRHTRFVYTPTQIIDGGRNWCHHESNMLAGSAATGNPSTPTSLHQIRTLCYQCPHLLIKCNTHTLKSFISCTKHGAVGWFAGYLDNLYV